MAFRIIRLALDRLRPPHAAHLPAFFLPGLGLRGPAAGRSHYAVRSHCICRTGPHQVRAGLPGAYRIWQLHPLLPGVSPYALSRCAMSEMKAEINTDV